ncbi:hypothetical protein Xcel_1857 [Xylanimonas cellulosilytica DSM 15894]|uniref:Inner membrane protein n=1 Tax=Xylanimonas cellulosilytica (strain DSM 15894 / JCM 12276 / CECT 5975 / KCTC 9989 / LMG 20990 / NBRC 107835 / XIL07) TaxID=446471 RepID=D1BT35_XYLCX|nr:YgjV family protein [Xylanimonas cellulosilytica]ACZ30877.1 hypothetical protein Xcel_1857 [Xylanimonas cellulosilytica DSM 15894]
MDSFLGMPIEVGMDRFILGQVFGLLTLVFNFAAYQADDQRKYFLRFTIGSAFWLAMYMTMGAQVPVMLVATFSTLRGVVFWWTLGKDSPRRRMIARRTMYTTLAIAGVASVVAIPAARPETQPFQVFLLIGVLLFVVGQYMPGVYLVRITAVVYAVAVLLLNTPLDTFNPVGIIIELNNLVSIAVFFVILARKNKHRARLAALRPAALALATPA